MASRLSAVRPLHAASRSIVARTINVASRTHDQMEMFGRILFFVVEVVAYIPYTVRHFRKEIWRQLGDVTFGSRMLAVAASTVVVATLITAVVGVNLGISGLQGLNILGLGPLAGALSSFGNTRELAPLLTAFGLAAQMGCRFTAQLGAMRVSEEIDALEVMSIPSLPYLITTRLIAALIMVIPLYLFALSGAFLGLPVNGAVRIEAGLRHVPPLFLSISEPQGRSSVRGEGHRVLLHDHDRPLLLRLQRYRWPRGRRTGRRPGHPGERRRHSDPRHAHDLPFLGAVDPLPCVGMTIAPPAPIGGSGLSWPAAARDGRHHGTRGGGHWQWPSHWLRAYWSSPPSVGRSATSSR